MIYGIDGQFGSGKTSYGVFLASRFAPGNIVFTNAKLNTVKIPNVYEMGSTYDDLLSVLRTINVANDLQRLAFNYPIKGTDLMYYPRQNYTRFMILFDESGASINNKDKIDTVYQQYVDQNRKLFTDIYLVSADGGSNNKGLRKYVDWWFYSVPFANFPILNNIKVIRKQKREQDGVTVRKEQYLGMDSEGDWVTKERLMDYYETFYWQPGVWTLYDDLYKNIKDPNKYDGIRMEDLRRIVLANPYLSRIIEKKENFSFLRSAFSVDELRSLQSEEVVDLDKKGNLLFISDDEYGYEIQEYDDPFEQDFLALQDKKEKKLLT